MKYKEKEKLWLGSVKNLCKAYGWRFKGYFIFKSVGDLFFCSNFYIGRDKNEISGWLGYKPMSIDNVFWDIIGEEANKKMPLSFRGEAAFCVRDFHYFEYKVAIENELNPSVEITQLLKNIEGKVFEKLSESKTLEDFRNDMMTEEKRNTVGIVTSYIEEGRIEQALTKIKEYRANEFWSGFGFGDKDFYDLAKEFCEKKYN
jgi:hypothetical protein